MQRFRSTDKDREWTEGPCLDSRSSKGRDGSDGTRLRREERGRDEKGMRTGERGSSEGRREGSVKRGPKTKDRELKRKIWKA